VVLPDSLVLSTSLRVAPRLGRGMVSRLHVIRPDGQSPLPAALVGLRSRATSMERKATICDCDHFGASPSAVNGCQSER
jgi:hypothetical protein